MRFSARSLVSCFFVLSCVLIFTKLRILVHAERKAENAERGNPAFVPKSEVTKPSADPRTSHRPLNCASMDEGADLSGDWDDFNPAHGTHDFSRPRSSTPDSQSTILRQDTLPEPGFQSRTEILSARSVGGASVPPRWDPRTARAAGRDSWLTRSPPGNQAAALFYRREPRDGRGRRWRRVAVGLDCHQHAVRTVRRLSGPAGPHAALEKGRSSEGHFYSFFRRVAGAPRVSASRQFARCRLAAGTQLRRRAAKGRGVCCWITFPEAP